MVTGHHHALLHLGGPSQPHLLFTPTRDLVFPSFYCCSCPMSILDLAFLHEGVPVPCVNLNRLLHSRDFPTSAQNTVKCLIVAGAHVPPQLQSGFSHTSGSSTATIPNTSPGALSSGSWLRSPYAGSHSHVSSCSPAPGSVHGAVRGDRGCIQLPHRGLPPEARVPAEVRGATRKPCVFN